MRELVHLNWAEVHEEGQIYVQRQKAIELRGVMPTIPDLFGYCRAYDTQLSELVWGVEEK